MHKSFISAGFTLIELLIALAIFSILVGISLPNSQNGMQIVYRHEAKTKLTTISLLQIDHFSRHQQYVQLHDLAIDLTSNKYLYTIQIAANNQYKITATAINHQRNDSDCLKLSLDHNLTRVPETCW